MWYTMIFICMYEHGKSFKDMHQIFSSIFFEGNEVLDNKDK